MINRIEGVWSEEDWYGAVTLDGVILHPGPSQRVINHSPDGFAWGYGGSGPAQLALAVLLALGVPRERALALYQQFKADFIARAENSEPLLIEVDILDWVKRNDRQGRP